jgi:hypothetical protein
MISHVPGPIERLRQRIACRYVAWLDGLCTDIQPIVITVQVRAPEREKPAPLKRGRKRATSLEKVRERIASAGGELEGSYEALSDRLGLSSKASARRAVHALAAAGVVSLAASPLGTLVRLT